MRISNMNRQIMDINLRSLGMEPLVLKFQLNQ